MVLQAGFKEKDGHKRIHIFNSLLFLLFNAYRHFAGLCRAGVESRGYFRSFNSRNPS